MLVSSILSSPGGQLSLLNTLRAQWQAKVDSVKFEAGATKGRHIAPAPLFQLPPWFGIGTGVNKATDPVQANAALASRRFGQTLDTTARRQGTPNVYA